MKLWSLGKSADSQLHSTGEKIHLENPRNTFYDRVSGTYHTLFLIFLAALLVFVCVAMLCNTELFTYENFYYLVKDINASSNLLSGSGNVINYETSVRNQTFTLYRGGLAVGGDSGLQLFTATGRETLNTSPDYTDPVLKGSERFLLMYDIGEKRYSIYNSFVCVHHVECDYPIFAGAISKSGYYAVVSESYEHAGVVSLYNDRFELINRYSRTEMVTCIDVNQAGNRIAFATAGMVDGEYVTTLVIATVGQAQIGAEMIFEGMVAYRVSFIDQHRLLLVGDHAAYIISVDDGTVLTPITYTGMQLSYVDCNDGLIALLFCINPVTDTYRMIITDQNGGLIFDQTFDAGISQLMIEDRFVFFLTENSIIRMDPRTLSYDSIDCKTNDKTLLIRTQNEVILCGAQSAIYYQFD